MPHPKWIKPDTIDVLNAPHYWDCLTSMDAIDVATHIFDGARHFSSELSHEERKSRRRIFFSSVGIGIIVPRTKQSAWGKGDTKEW